MRAPGEVSMQTRARWDGSSSAAERASRQITELAGAFRGFGRTVPGLSVEVVGHVSGNRQLVHPVAGFHVRLAEQGSVGVSLYVSSKYAELVRWKPGAGALRERFDVSLDEHGYGWGETVFPTAQELAHDLVAYMQFNADTLRKN
jgi:hypothetical protein